MRNYPMLSYVTSDHIRNIGTKISFWLFVSKISCGPRCLNKLYPQNPKSVFMHSPYYYKLWSTGTKTSSHFLDEYICRKMLKLQTFLQTGIHLALITKKGGATSLAFALIVSFGLVLLHLSKELYL